MEKAKAMDTGCDCIQCQCGQMFYRAFCTQDPEKAAEIINAEAPRFAGELSMAQSMYAAQGAAQTWLAENPGMETEFQRFELQTHMALAKLQLASMAH